METGEALGAIPSKTDSVYDAILKRATFGHEGHTGEGGVGPLKPPLTGLQVPKPDRLEVHVPHDGDSPHFQKGHFQHAEITPLLEFPVSPAKENPVLRVILHGIPRPLRQWMIKPHP